MAIFCSSFRGNLVPIVFFAIFNLSFNDAKMANLGTSRNPGAWILGKVLNLHHENQ